MRWKTYKPKSRKEIGKLEFYTPVGWHPMKFPFISGSKETIKKTRRLK